MNINRAVLTEMREKSKRRWDWPSHVVVIKIQVLQGLDIFDGTLNNTRKAVVAESKIFHTCLGKLIDWNNTFELIVREDKRFEIAEVFNSWWDTSPKLVLFQVDIPEHIRVFKDVRNNAGESIVVKTKLGQSFQMPKFCRKRAVQFRVVLEDQIF